MGSSTPTYRKLYKIKPMYNLNRSMAIYNSANYRREAELPIRSEPESLLSPLGLLLLGMVLTQTSIKKLEDAVQSA